MTVNQIRVRLASHEWGDETMRRAAEQAAAEYPMAEDLYIHVYEHAGWYLAWFREKPGDTLVIIDSANDLAKYSGKAAEIRDKFSLKGILINSLGMIERPERVA